MIIRIMSYDEPRKIDIVVSVLELGKTSGFDRVTERV